MITSAETFRDSIGTITAEGKRNWIFAKKPRGRLYNARTVVSIIYLIIFFTLPWIKVHGEPLFLFNVIERKFILFGTVFWPQDFFLFVIAMLTFMVFVVLFTVVYGRVFCGWVCPQTIFMEMVFRKVEYWIDGDAEKQKRLDAQSWNGQKLLKRGVKFVAFWGISFVIAHYFLSYIIGMDKVVGYIRDGAAAHIATLIPLVVFTTVFFAVYWGFREQACLIVCPYGRLQGVMLDQDSMVVAYDYVRGEPRAKVTKDKTKAVGDCVDCKACVRVCPTGIDIRNGTQMECVNCTACIDACNDIMFRLDRPEGLIRIASENSIAKKEKIKVTPRMLAYSGVLVVLLAVLIALLATRKDIQTNVMRAQGMLYQQVGNDKVSNLYNVTLLNKTRRNLPVTLKIENNTIGAAVQWIGNPLTVKAETSGEAVFFIVADKNKIQQRKTPVEIGVYSDGKQVDKVKTNFMGPGH